MVEAVREKIHMLDSRIKKLSREGSTLKEVLDSAPARRRSWSNLPMREIMAMQGAIKPKAEVEPEAYSSLGVAPEASKELAAGTLTVEDLVKRVVS